MTLCDKPTPNASKLAKRARKLANDTRLNGHLTAHDYSIPRYLAVVVAGWALNQALMYFGVRFIGLHYLVVQFASMGIIVVANFLAFQWWAFAKSTP